jgi:probable HAF family extracellular repeat protein
MLACGMRSLTVLALVTATARVASAQPTWVATGGTLGGTFSRAGGINDAGQVVGSGDTVSGAGHACFYRLSAPCELAACARMRLQAMKVPLGESSAMRMIPLLDGLGRKIACLVAAVAFAPVVAGSAAAQSGWTVTDLGVLPGSTSSVARDINDSGAVVGDSTLDSGASPRAFLWTAATGMQDLGTLAGAPYSQAFGINNAGQVVGWSREAFLWSPSGGMVSLGTLAGGSGSTAYAINDVGQVVGASGTASGATHAFLWTASGGMVDLGTLGGQYSWAYSVNSAGQVVGESETAGGAPHAFLWTPAGGMVDPGTLCDFSRSWANGINNVGQVVGGGWAGGTSFCWLHVAFLWTATTGMVDLGPLLDVGGNAMAINDAGQVVGYSITRNGQRAFLWTAAGGAVDLGVLEDSFYRRGVSTTLARSSV